MVDARADHRQPGRRAHRTGGQPRQPLRRVRERGAHRRRRHRAIRREGARAGRGAAGAGRRQGARGGRLLHPPALRPVPRQGGQRPGEPAGGQGGPLRRDRHRADRGARRAAGGARLRPAGRGQADLDAARVLSPAARQRDADRALPPGGGRRQASRDGGGGRERDAAGRGEADRPHRPRLLHRRAGRRCAAQLRRRRRPAGGVRDRLGASHVAASSAAAAASPPPPAPGSAAEVEAAASALRLPLQPPLQQLTRQACVVYALGG